mgnify:CR=1 FL=1
MCTDPKEIYLFEEYIEAIIDRRTAQQNYPGVPSSIEERNVEEAREALFKYLKELP